MLLRSSSTPVLGSLLPSFSDSPRTELHTPNSIHGKVHHPKGGRSNCLSRPLFRSTSAAEINGTTSSSYFRRVQSEGNLEELLDASYGTDESKKLARKTNCYTLEAIPSFSYGFFDTPFEGEDSDDDDDDDAMETEGEESGEESLFVFRNSVLQKEKAEVKNDYKYNGLGLEGEGKMYLATGLGMVGFADGGGNCGGGGGGCRPFDRDGGDNHGVSLEEHYKRMLEGDPGNPLVLKNYAYYLYKIKDDLKTAEEYYARAILADPKDGESLSQYATLTWELHHDQRRANEYFERAVQASPDNSHIHAAYASFLWDTDDEDEDEIEITGNSAFSQPNLYQGSMAAVTKAFSFSSSKQES